MDRFCCIVLLLCVFGTALSHISAPYQATIRLYNSYNQNTGGNFDICSGAVIHESYVLTTAHCVHSHIIAANISHPYLPGMIYIVAGRILGTAEYTRYVVNITIHENYNPSTLENDIAILKLNEPLPLLNDPELKWIELEDKSIYGYEHCFASFRNQSTHYPFTIPLHLNVVDKWFCNKSATLHRNNDLCANYIFTENATCQMSREQFQLSNDRGTPLLCNNHLTGLLSVVTQADNSSANATVCAANHRTWAVYTKVDLYTKWIYSKIGVPSNFAQQSPQLYGQPYFNSQSPTHAVTGPVPPKKSNAVSICMSFWGIFSVLLINFVVIVIY